MIRAILNADINWGVGRKNGLLFHLPLDMKFFKETTLNHTVAMGENTLLSFPGSKPLKNRTNIVLSGDPSHNHEGVINVHTFEEFIATIKEHAKKDDVYIVGGASIYKQMLPFVDEVLLTRVYADGKAEVFFVDLDNDPNFKLITPVNKINDNGVDIAFLTYKRV